MEEKKPLLKKMEKSFNMIVTAPLEAKIRYLCSMFPDKEYSGTLFYTFKGTLKKGDLIIFAKDFYLQDIGNATYTEFKNDATLVTYMIENNLLDCCTGIMHSHNRMATFFSGTDIATLESEGKDTNHFVSLIVNNRGDYNAMITSKVIEKVTGKKTSKHCTFNDHKFETITSYADEETIIEAYPLEIKVEGRYYTKALNDRIKVINDAKVEAFQKMSFQDYNKKYNDWDATSNNPYFPTIPKNAQKDIQAKKEKKEPVQLQLFDDDDDAGLENAHCSKKVLEATLAQVITGDVFASMKKLDMTIWKNNMVKIYEKRFGNQMIGKDPAWYIWITFMFEFLESTFMDDTLKFDDETNKMIWAYDVIDELKKIPKNQYVDAYIELFEELTA